MEVLFILIQTSKGKGSMGGVDKSGLDSHSDTMFSCF